MWPECSHGNPFPSHTAPTEPDKHHLPLQKLLLGSSRMLSWGLLKFTDCHSLCWLSFLRNSRGIVGSRNAGHQWLPSHVLRGPFITSFKGETARLCQETKKGFYFEGNIIIGLLCINTWFCGKLIALFIVKLASGISCLRVNYRHLNTFNQSLPNLNQTDLKQAGGWRTWRSVRQPSAPTSSSETDFIF